jgi:hypothetical protein
MRRGLLLWSALWIGLCAGAAQAIPITVENWSFESPGTGKLTSFATVPGWSVDSVPADSDSGVEQGWAPTDGDWTAYLRGSPIDPPIWQLTDHVIAYGDVFELKVDARVTYAATTLRMTLYYDDNGTRVVAATQDVAIKESMTEYALRFASAALPASIGHRIGIEFANPSGSSTWLGLDRVRLDLLEQGVLGGAVWPTPADGATDVPRNVVLRWQPGPWAIAHDVYFGESLTDVNSVTTADPLSVLQVSGSGATTLDVGRLEYGRTYYWRVDEINAPPDSSLIRGNVWSFTVEPYSIAIPGSRITASASSVAKAETGPDKTINGAGLNASDQHSTAAADMWFSASPAPQPVWIRYAFDQPYVLDKVMVWNSNQSTENALGLGAKNVTIEYSMDGEAWTALGDFVFNRATAKSTYTANTEVDFGGIAARYIRITISSNWGGKLQQFSLSEVRFFSIPVAARLPDPAPGATDVDAQVTLSWRAGRYAASHQVYLSMDQRAVTDGTAAVVTTSQPSYDATVDLAETYYWKVVEVNEAKNPPAWASEVWSFSTADFIPVDDFERYSDASPNRVFQTWHDGAGFSADEFFPSGYAGNSTGSIVGYDPQLGNIMETNVVHGGRKAMPLEYHNTAGVTTSEATRTFDGAQDWTKSGVKTLVLCFYGDPANAACQLYVKLNSTKIAYDGEAANLARRRWFQWSIDLSQLAASALRGITSLTIGVENAGEGILVIDDICLYRTAPEVPAAVNPGNAGLVAYYAMNNSLQDSSGSGNHGTAIGSPTYAPSAPGYGTALQLDGLDDCVDLGNKAVFSPTGSLSIALWANIVNWSTMEWGHVMVSNRGENGIGWQINRPGTSPTLCFITRGTGGDQVISVTSMPLNEWIHIACVYDNAANVKVIYINGMQDTVTATVPGAAIATTTHDTYVGARANSGNTGPEAFFTGLLDEIHIYDRALSAGEVEYLADPTP